LSEYGYIEPPGTRRPTKKRRNARARYQLTELGTSSLGTYREQVADAQTHGRETLEAAQLEWATARGVESGDALLLDELDGHPQTILELTRSLDTCCVKRPQVEAGIDRLSEQLLIEPVGKPAPPPTPEPRPYY